MSNLTKLAAGAIWWSALEIATRFGTQFVVMVILARLLSPSDFGLIAILLIFTGIGALLVDSGFGTALIQRQHTTDDDETTVFLSSCTIGVVAAGVLYVGAPAIAAFFSQPRLVELSRAIAVVLPLGALAAVPDALLTMRLNFRARAASELVASIVSGTTAIVLALRGFGVWSLVFQVIASIAVRGAMLWSLSRWRPRGRFRRESFRSLFGFGGFMLLTNLLNAISLRLQSLLVGRLFSAGELGYYSLAQNTQSAPASLTANLLNRVGLPLFSTISGDRTKLLTALRMSLRTSMFIFVPCLMGMALVSKPLVILVYGQRWAPAAPILSILALSAALWPMHVLNLAAIGAQGKSNLLLRVELLKQAVAITLILGFSPWGPVAIAWGVLAGSLASVAINAHYSRVLLGYGALAQLREQIPTFLLSMAAAIVGWAILHWTPAGAPSLLAAILAAASVYVSLAVLSRNASMRDLLDLSRNLATHQGAAR